MSKSYSTADQSTANAVKISVDDFGLLRRAHNGNNDSSDELIKQITFRTGNQMEVQIITYGATIKCIKVPDNAGNVIDVLLGYDRMEQLMNNASIKLGSVVNFIKCADDTLDKCLSSVNWQYHLRESTLFLTTLLKEAMITCTFRVTHDNSLRITYDTIASLPLFINLTSNMYFNLAGHNANCRRLYKQTLILNAAKYLPNKINEGDDATYKAVGGTACDLRIAHRIGSFIRKTPNFGYNHSFVLSKDSPEVELPFVGRLFEPDREISLSIFSNANICGIDTANDWPYSQHAIPNSSHDNRSASIASRLGLSTQLEEPNAKEEHVLMKKLADIARNSRMEEDETSRRMIFYPQSRKNCRSLLKCDISALASVASFASSLSSVGCDECHDSKRCIHADNWKRDAIKREIPAASATSSISIQCEKCNETDNSKNLDNKLNEISFSLQQSRYDTPIPSPTSSISSIGCEECRYKDNENEIRAKNGACYKQHGGIGFTILLHRGDEPFEMIRPGCLYRHEVVYKFDVTQRWR